MYIKYVTIGAKNRFNTKLLKYLIYCNETMYLKSSLCLILTALEKWESFMFLVAGASIKGTALIYRQCSNRVMLFFCNFNSKKLLLKKNTEGSRLMRISLVRISLLRFFKTFQIYLAYAFLGLFISLLRFLYCDHYLKI